MTDDTFSVLDKLAKWRTVFASWQLGTRLKTDGELRAVKDHREVTIFLRAEVSALVVLLESKGVFTGDEWLAALTAEAKRLDKDYEEKFPGWKSTPIGMNMKMPEAGETMKRMGFPQ